MVDSSFSGAVAATKTSSSSSMRFEEEKRSGDEGDSVVGSVSCQDYIEGAIRLYE